MTEDGCAGKKSILLVGRPGVGKTTVLRDMARVLSTEIDRKVMIIDASCEIAGYGLVPHAAIGKARRLQVPLQQEPYQAMVRVYCLAAVVSMHLPMPHLIVTGVRNLG